MEQDLEIRADESGTLSLVVSLDTFGMRTTMHARLGLDSNGFGEGRFQLHSLGYSPRTFRGDDGHTTLGSCADTYGIRSELAAVWLRALAMGCGTRMQGVAAGIARDSGGSSDLRFTVEEG